MTVCDLCDSRVDVTHCVIALPDVKEADSDGDLCPRCQRKVHEFMKAVRVENFGEPTAAVKIKAKSRA